MAGMIKKYLPYAIVIFAVYLLVPLIFISEPMQKFSPVCYYFILLMTQVVCSAVYCAKHGLDFLFTLIAPIAFLFTMMIYAGGFGNPTNIILLVVYLISGIFGLFLGDLAFGDARRKQEKKEKQAAEELLLQAKRRDEREKQRMANENARTRRAENVQRAILTMTILITTSICPTSIKCSTIWTTEKPNTIIKKRLTALVSLILYTVKICVPRGDVRVMAEIYFIFGIYAVYQQRQFKNILKTVVR